VYKCIFIAQTLEYGEEGRDAWRLQIFVWFSIFTYSGESVSSAQQTVNLKMERVRGRVQALQKSWQVLIVALAFSCLESLRDLSPLKRVILTKDWVGAAKRASPSLPGQRTTVLNMYSFVQFV
jgi:hypothetical protein